MSDEEKKRVVIVDDDDDLLRSVIFVLESEGLDVKGFKTGQDGIDYLTNEENLKACSLLILDRLLPDMDGLDVLAAVNEKFPQHCPVLILSLLSSDKDVLSGLTTGALDYITKPFNLEIFAEKVKKLTRA